MIVSIAITYSNDDDDCYYIAITGGVMIVRLSNDDDDDDDVVLLNCQLRARKVSIVVENNADELFEQSNEML